MKIALVTSTVVPILPSFASLDSWDFRCLPVQENIWTVAGEQPQAISVVTLPHTARAPPRHWSDSPSAVAIWSFLAEVTDTGASCKVALSQAHTVYLVALSPQPTLH